MANDLLDTFSNCHRLALLLSTLSSRIYRKAPESRSEVARQGDSCSESFIEKRSWGAMEPLLVPLLWHRRRNFA